MKNLINLIKVYFSKENCFLSIKSKFISFGSISNITKASGPRLTFSAALNSYSKWYGWFVNNSNNILRLCKIIGSMCVLSVVFNKHILLNFNIANIILIISIFHLLCVLVTALIKLIKSITSIFSIEGIIKLINNLIILFSVSILLNKIYINNSKLLDNINLSDNVYILFLVLTILSALFIVFIYFKNKNIKIIKYLINGFVYCALFIGKLFFSPVILCADDSESTITDNNNNTNNQNNETNQNNNTDSTGKTTINNFHNHIHVDGMTRAVGEAVATTAKGTVGDVAAQAITQLGIGGTIVGAMGVGATISKGQPPLTRAATTVLTGVAGGTIHVAASSMNRSLNQVSLTHNLSTNSLPQSAKPSTPTSEPSSPGEGFINCPNEEFSIVNFMLDMLNDNSVGLWLASVLILAITNLLFLIILLIAVLSKYVLSLNYQFNWVDKFLSSSNSAKVKHYLKKLIQLLIKIREYNIIMYIILLVITSTLLVYFLFNFYINLEELCKLYLKLKNK